MSGDRPAGVAEPPAISAGPLVPEGQGPVGTEHDRVAYGALVVFVLFVSRIAMAQIAYSVALIAWLLKPRKTRRAIIWPYPLLPVAVLAGLTVLSCLFSGNLRESLPRLRQFALFVVLFLMVNVVDTVRKRQTLVYCLFASCVFLAGWGIVEYALNAGAVDPLDGVGYRIRGPVGHWMTYSGLLTLGVSMSFAYLVFDPSRRRRWIHAAVSVVLSVTLALTLTRGAYLALTVALGLLLILRRPVLVAVLPMVLGLAFVAAPRAVQERVASMISGNDDTKVDRLYLWQSGLRMIADHPLLGVGLGQVPVQYREVYRDPDAPKTRNNHLHNNVLQVAAERGIPALLVWIWLFAAVVKRQIAGLRGAKRPPPALVGSLLAVAAFHTFGLVEYNFGDSEILMLLLFLISIPYLQTGPERSESSPGHTIAVKP